VLDLETIRTDGGTQSRESLHQDTYIEYAEAMLAGEKFPPIIVFHDGANYWLADGFHRFFGAMEAGIDALEADVRQGTQLDAQLFSYGANYSNGLRRTNADKRRAVTGALKHPVSITWSDNQIAKHCGVSHTFVSRIRASLATVASEKPAERTYTTKHGTEAVMKTGKIGKAKPEKAVAPAQDQQQAAAVDKPGPEGEEPYDPREDQLKEAEKTITELAAENDELRDRVAVGVMEGTEQEKQEAAQVIADLRHQVKTLEAENAALRSSRDAFQREASELRKQIKMNERELKKARAAA
jgi:hypothetical protein